MKHIRQQRTLFADIDRFADLGAVLRLLAEGVLRHGEERDRDNEYSGHHGGPISRLPGGHFGLEQAATLSWTGWLHCVEYAVDCVVIPEGLNF